MSPTRKIVHVGIVFLLLLVGVVGSLTLIDKKNTCPILMSPVDTTKVTSVLYPGQYRGGDYKAHGGFRLDDLPTNDVTITAPISAKLTHAGRYIEIGEVQYIFLFKTNCGLTYRFDHLLTLTPKFQAVADKLPPAVEGWANYVAVRPAVAVETGETIATAVGFKQNEKDPNVSFDFGVYLGHSGKQGLCWLDLLSPHDATVLKAMPGGDFKSGKMSDYCK